MASAKCAEAVIVGAELLEEVRTNLVSVEVDAVDQKADTSWLADWEEFVTVGFRYRRNRRSI